MKKVIIALVALVAFSGAAFAKDVVELNASMGKVSFPHKAHKELLKAEGCKACHPALFPMKEEKLGKEKAHKACGDCHAKGNGPKTTAACTKCHKK